MKLGRKPAISPTTTDFDRKSKVGGIIIAITLAISKQQFIQQQTTVAATMEYERGNIPKNKSLSRSTSSPSQLPHKHISNTEIVLNQS